MTTRRVFFALPPAPALQQELAGVADDVASRARGRASSAGSIHLTLAFLGDIGVERIAALAALGAAISAPCFALTLDRLGGFRRARVAWIAPAAPPPALAMLQQTLADALAREGFPSEARPFMPHLTLARHCTETPPAVAAVPALEWPVNAFALWASATAPRGARYDELARWRLA